MEANTKGCLIDMNNTWLKNSTLLVLLYKLSRVLQIEYSFNLFRFFKDLSWFWSDYSKFIKLMNDSECKYEIETRRLYPCLRDKIAFTPVEYIYFYQDTWAAKKIFELSPQRHFDVGSSVKSMSLIAQSVPVTMIDIRPPDVVLEGFTFVAGSILSLPFDDGAIESLSSLCVIEHIGLGRYGDQVDPLGSEKACQELSRVVATGGNLLVSVPVDDVDRVYFNAHRAFTPSSLVAMFPDMELVDEAYIYGNRVYKEYDSGKGFGTGMFHFVKRGCDVC